MKYCIPLTAINRKLPWKFTAQKLKKMKKIFLKQDKAGSDTKTQIEVKQNKKKE